MSCFEEMQQIPLSSIFRMKFKIPVWISWRCRNIFSLAIPWPSSSSPWVKTPSMVDFPLFSIPITATRSSKLGWSSGTFLINTSATTLVLRFVTPELTTDSRSTDTVAPNFFPISLSVLRLDAMSSTEIPLSRPQSSTPNWEV